jgi:hypothetical protein
MEASSEMTLVGREGVEPPQLSRRFYTRLRVFETGPKKPETQRFENRLSRVIF